MSGPNLIFLAGPNGAGKTTASAKLLAGTLAVEEFVNADIIAKGISRFHPEKAAIEAGRIMLRRLDELTAQRVNVAFETTLASRSFAPMIRRLTTEGYRFRLVFLWLPSAEMAVNRVRDRVSVGGHNVPEEVIRGYEAGLRNFFQLYAPLAASWEFYDNSVPNIQRLVAGGSLAETADVVDRDLWQNLEKTWK